MPLGAQQLGSDTDDGGDGTSGMHAPPPAYDSGNNAGNSGAHAADAGRAAPGRARRQLPDTAGGPRPPPTCHCTKEPSTAHSLKWWGVFTELAEVLHGELDVPYQLSSGTLLNFHRDCEILSNDVDISVSLDWWQAGDNRERLQAAMEKRDFKLMWLKNKGTFATTHTYGYEEQYTKHGATGPSSHRVDMFASISNPGT